MYIIRDRQAGNVIYSFFTLKDAEETLEEYETEDRNNGTYEADFYEIVKKE